MHRIRFFLLAAAGLPLTAKIVAEQMSRLDALEAGRSINGNAPGGN